MLLRGALLAHCDRVGRRMALIDPDPLTLEPAQAIEAARGLTSDRGAYYWPWLLPTSHASPPAAPVPPSGHVAGVYARSARSKGVHEPPANLALDGVAGVTRTVDAATHGWLNHHHVNLLTPVAGEFDRQAYEELVDQVTVTGEVTAA